MKILASNPPAPVAGRIIQSGRQGSFVRGGVYPQWPETAPVLRARSAFSLSTLGYQNLPADARECWRDRAGEGLAGTTARVVWGVQSYPSPPPDYPPNCACTAVPFDIEKPIGKNSIYVGWYWSMGVVDTIYLAFSGYGSLPNYPAGLPAFSTYEFEGYAPSVYLEMATPYTVLPPPYAYFLSWTKSGGVESRRCYFALST